MTRHQNFLNLISIREEREIAILASQEDDRHISTSYANTNSYAQEHAQELVQQGTSPTILNEVF